MSATITMAPQEYTLIFSAPRAVTRAFSLFQRELSLDDFISRYFLFDDTKLLASCHLPKAFSAQCMKHPNSCMNLLKEIDLIQGQSVSASGLHWQTMSLFLTLYSFGTQCVPLAQRSAYFQMINEIFLYTSDSQLPEGVPTPSVSIHQPMAELPTR